MFGNFFPQGLYSKRRNHFQKLHVMIGQGFPHDFCPCGKRKLFVYFIIGSKIGKPFLFSTRLRPVYLHVFFCRIVRRFPDGVSSFHCIGKISPLFLRPHITLHQKLFICIFHGFDTDFHIFRQGSFGGELFVRLNPSA